MNRIMQFGFYSLLTNIDKEALPTKRRFFYLLSVRMNNTFN
ncbi:hypothetical protein BFZC1_02722 [Lysinibacillus fusiformis ZC1]|nr:hypothetical protein BFZC1_02722 [Lysinibacillus fusiformis ZC1]